MPTLRPPEFIGIGAQRCGTTWWFELLLTHPHIEGPKSGFKEQHFFDRFCRRGFTDEDPERYWRKFFRRPGQIAGEWTPRYMFDFWTPPLLLRAAPEAKILIMLRDPIERFRSGVPHRLSATRDHRLNPVVADAIERGRYATQLRRVFASIPREQILLLQYERCRDDPARYFRTTLEFLGVDADHVPPSFAETRGTTQVSRKQPLWDDMRDALRATYEPEVSALAELAPEIDIALWPNFADLAAHAVER
jgi:hypothetical protein